MLLLFTYFFFASSAKLPLFQEKKVEWNGENKWYTIDAPYNTPILYPPFLRGKTSIASPWYDMFPSSSSLCPVCE